jgi:chromosome segregation ATPase
MALESLKLLEAKINGFLARHEQVCGEKDDLSVRLREREQEYYALLEQLRQYERERSEIRARLEKILNRFEGLGEYMKDEG